MATKDPGDTPYTRTLQLAAKTLGSAERLAAVLAVEHAQLLRWISGAAFPPHEVFLQALDIVANGRSDKQTLADRTQRSADRKQARADRSQAKADRDQANADRAQRNASRTQQGEAATTDSASETQQQRHVASNDGESASDAPENQSKKTERS